MPDWARIHQEFKPIQQAAYGRATVATSVLALVALIGGGLLYWLVEDALVPAAILWGAAGVGLLAAGRKALLGHKQDPMVLCGLVVKKQTVVRADVNRRKQLKPMLAMSVSEAFELTPQGRGNDLPDRSGTQIVVAGPYVHRQVETGKPATLICLPSGEAMGIMHGDKLDLP